MDANAPEILDGVEEPLSDDQMAAARAVVGRLRSSADREHYDTGKRWRARCKCGDEWPCPEEAYLLDTSALLEAVVSELMVRRRFARPLTGLDRVAEGVRKARGGDAPRQIRGYA
jgi:hypothetical protein